MSHLCSYPNKKCQNPRAVRRNGQLHSFCEIHRMSANEAQKRWYTNKKNRIAAGLDDARSPTVSKKTRRGRVSFRRSLAPSPYSVDEIRISDWDVASIIELQQILLSLSTDEIADETSSSPTVEPVILEQDPLQAMGFE